MVFLFLLGCYNSSSAVFCRNLSEEYSALLKKDETVHIFSWEDLYHRHELLVGPLIGKWKQSSIKENQLFSLTFYAFLRSQAVFECGTDPEQNDIILEEMVRMENAGLTEIKRKKHPYFVCLLEEWRKTAKPLIFKSCNYYLNH